MRGIIIKKYCFFSVIFTKNGDFLKIKNKAKTKQIVVGEEIEFDAGDVFTSFLTFFRPFRFPTIFPLLILTGMLSH